MRAMSCRLGRVPFDRSFGALLGGHTIIPSALSYIVHFLSIAKKFDKEKI